MRLVDTDATDRKLFYKQCMGKDSLISVESAYEMLMALPEVKAVPIETLDKIRAEMENDWQLKKYPSSPFSCGLRRAIEIIDKYRGEQT